MYSIDGISTVGWVECEARYTLNGAASLLCLSDGRWNDTIPTCGMSKCGSVILIVLNTELSHVYELNLLHARWYISECKQL